MKRKSSHAEADLVRVLEPSPSRVAPPCAVFGQCGGCSWQHVAIEAQEQAKARIVTDSMRAVPGFDPAAIDLHDLAASPDPFRYRNKMELAFGRDDDAAPLKLGFHFPGDWKRVLDVDRCWLQPEPLDALIAAAKAEGERQRLTAWSPKTHAGTLRQLLLRWSVAEQRGVAALLTGDEKLDFPAFRDALLAACPQLKAVVWGINAGRSDVARPERIVHVEGDPVLIDRIGDCEFQVSLTSFFQTNTRGAERLYETAREYLGLTGRENLLDAYCGAGTIGIFCARQARRVFGVEIILEAVQDARRNAARNKLSNCTFMAGDMGPTLPKLLAAIEGPVDRLVVDPPRSGMDKRALAALIDIKAPVLVYVSCNPTTMARDLAQVVEAGYVVEKLRPVDMFPQTYHIECVARCVLTR